MAPTKQPKRAYMTFNEKNISFDALTRSITSAPEITLKSNDLNADSRALWALTDDDAEVTAHIPVCVYKLGSQYIVLCNWGRVSKFLTENQALPAGKLPGVIKVRLISKQMLKHIETISIPAEKQNAQADKVERAMEESRQEDFNNRPRWDDRSQGRPFQPRDNTGYRPQSDRPITQRRSS